MSKTKPTSLISNEAKFKTVAAMMKTATHPKVKEIAKAILQSETAEMNVGSIYRKTGEEQSLTSQMLKKMKDVNLVKSHREGKQIFYSMNVEIYDKINEAVGMF
jgi:ArsR family transcriptional regulator